MVFNLVLVLLKYRTVSLAWAAWFLVTEVNKRFYYKFDSLLKLCLELQVYKVLEEGRREAEPFEAPGTFLMVTLLQ